MRKYSLHFMLGVFLLISCGCKKTQPPIKYYRVVSGEVKEIKTPELWQKYKPVKVLKNSNMAAKLLLSDYSEVELNGILAVSKKKRCYYLIEGQAHFHVKPQQIPFIVTTRVGQIKVLGTDFISEVKNIPGKNQKKPDDNAAKLRLQVNSGKIAFQQIGNPQARIVKAGENVFFTLGQVKYNGKIQALGFGYSLRSGAIGKILRKRSAQASALRSLAEFKNGMAFVVAHHQKGYFFQKASFSTQGTISRSSVKYDLQALNKNLLVCSITAKLEKKNAVARRNAKLRKAQGSSLKKDYKNLPMALLGARNNAILNLIKNAAVKLYGDKIPEKLQGTVYPVAFNAKLQKNRVIANVSGEVIFD